MAAEIPTTIDGVTPPATPETPETTPLAAPAKAESSSWSQTLKDLNVDVDSLKIPPELQMPS